MRCTRHGPISTSKRQAHAAPEVWFGVIRTRRPGVHDSSQGSAPVTDKGEVKHSSATCPRAQWRPFSVPAPTDVFLVACPSSGTARAAEGTGMRLRPPQSYVTRAYACHKLIWCSSYEGLWVFAGEKSWNLPASSKSAAWSHARADQMRVIARCLCAGT